MINEPQRLNLYSYCRNNPLIFIDKDGRKIRLSKDSVKHFGAGRVASPLTQNLLPSEQRNIGWKRDSEGSLQLTLKNSEAFEGKQTTNAYRYLKGVIEMKSTVDYTLVPKDTGKVFQGVNSGLSVTFNGLSNGNAGVTAQAANGNFDVFVAEGGLPRGTSSQQGTIVSFPEYLVAAHEVLGEVSRMIANSPPLAAVTIENLFRSEQRVPLRDGKDHRVTEAQPEENAPIVIRPQ